MMKRNPSVHASPLAGAPVGWLLAGSATPRLDSAGRLMSEVVNSGGAEIVPLQAGWYVVQAAASSRRMVAVKVQVVAGRTTEVHLDGRWMPQPSNMPATLVFGPDGAPVGMAALRRRFPRTRGRDRDSEA